jgi:hypothetical protein
MLFGFVAAGEPTGLINEANLIIPGRAYWFLLPSLLLMVIFWNSGAMLHSCNVYLFIFF